MDSHLDCGVCKLRLWQSADKPSLIEHADNFNVWRSVRDLFPRPYTETDADAFLSGPAKPDAANHIYAIDVEGEAVGGIGLHRNQDVSRFSMEIGYWLGESYWGRGIATAAVKTLSARALTEADIYRIFAIVFASNAASMRVLQKAGFRREGILKRAVIKNGVLMDSALYAITRETEHLYLPID